jgi:hypothetical protein
MSDRDPRRDPIPGDSVQHCVTLIMRTVTRVKDNDVTYQNNRRKDSGFCFISTWRQWAKGAKILKRGDSES